MSGLSRDGFLGGRLHLWQPAKGYRAGIDPVLLAAAVPARAGERVLELGCGVGAALLCLGTRVPGLGLTGIEVQADLAVLARRNAEAAELPARIAAADLTRLPAEMRGESYHHVMMNPPYFDRGAGTAAPDPSREGAMGEATPLDAWVAAAARRLRPGGRLTAIHDAARLPDLLAACAGRLGSVTVLPLAPRAGRSARRILLSARKDGRAPFTLLPPLVLHQGDRHQGDGDDYAPEVRAVLRDAAPLPWGPQKSAAF
ncbi:methyltransferase domain-containing protein [Rhodobacteraceae bacterium CCMM004]|nr:methyltransferase domain-containing protein [Rhodobacteraceae bacterium CCMM004]